jgi:hypothetical protein
MARARNSSKRNSRKRAASALGIAGVSLAMAGGASASTAGSAVVPMQNTATHHELFLGEEEISDVSLSTFYVFDKENDATLKAGVKTAWRGCRCGCARGCRCGWRGCGGCGGCGGCCLSWGRCRVC